MNDYTDLVRPSPKWRLHTIKYRSELDIHFRLIGFDTVNNGPLHFILFVVNWPTASTVNGRFFCLSLSIFLISKLGNWLDRKPTKLHLNLVHTHTITHVEADLNKYLFTRHPVQYRQVLRTYKTKTIVNSKRIQTLMGPYQVIGWFMPIFRRLLLKAATRSHVRLKNSDIIKLDNKSFFFWFIVFASNSVTLFIVLRTKTMKIWLDCYISTILKVNVTRVFQYNRIFLFVFVTVNFQQLVKLLTIRKASVILRVSNSLYYMPVEYHAFSMTFFIDKVFYTITRCHAHILIASAVKTTTTWLSHDVRIVY